jgi:hypothetical protein
MFGSGVVQLSATSFAAAMWAYRAPNLFGYEWAVGVGDADGSAVVGMGRLFRRTVPSGFQEVNPSITTDEIRALPGIAHGGENLPSVASLGEWLRIGVGQIPEEVAVQLRGRSFENWTHFRNEFWMAVGRIPELLSRFRLQNQRLILAGKAPFAPRSGALGMRATFELDHMEPLFIGGKNALYDLGKIMITTPRVNESFNQF